MAYSARINGELFFNTNSIDQEFALASAKLDLKAGAAGLFSFTVLPKNKYYDDFHLINDYIDVYRDYRLIFSGRVSSISQAFDLSMKIEAQGLLSILNDTIFRPVTHEGTLYQLLASIVASHNAQVESDKQITLGNVTIQDAACYRAYENYEKTFSRLKDLADSFGGYFSIRKEDGHLYLDWKGISTIGAQSVDFGENLLDITKDSNSEEYISVLIPLGAQIEDEETGTRSRVDIKSVNAGKDYIELPNATTKIVGVNTWDDVTEPANLLSKGQAYLNAQSILHTNIELSAIDLADAGVDTSHFEICTVINVTSRPHSLDNQPFECVSQSLNLLSPDDNTLSLGGVVEGFTIRSQKEAKLNTKLIERIDSNYTTNAWVNNVADALSTRIQENTTLIDQNSESITLLSQQVTEAAIMFYRVPVPPYSTGDLWYRGAEGDELSAVTGIGIPGMSIPGIGSDLFICKVSRGPEETFHYDDWEPTFVGQINQIGAINRRVTEAEIKVDASIGQIDLNTSNINYLSGEVTNVQLNMDSVEAELTLEVSRKLDSSDYNAASIVLMVNNAGSSIKLNADHIKLEGITTVNNYFKINLDGSMEATNGKFTGTITAQSGTIGAYTLGTDGYLTYGSIANSDQDGMRISAGAVILSKSRASGGGYGYYAYIGGTNIYFECENTLRTWTQAPVRCGIGAWSSVTGHGSGYVGRLVGNGNLSYITFGNDYEHIWSSGDTYGQDAVYIKKPLYVAGKFECRSDGFFLGQLTIRGGKPRVVDTKNYGDRLLYCYENPTPSFGDFGEGKLDSDGVAYVSIDDIFSETIANTTYLVFLQKEGTGDIWVEEKASDYFVVKGTPNLKFAWELKAYQRDYEAYRLETYAIDEYDDNIEIFDGIYENDYIDYIRQQEEVLYETT